MISVYGMSTSGNCHKARLLLEQTGRPYRWIETDSANGATRTPEYLVKNPNGRVPMLELEDGRLLVESNAILCYLAEGTDYLPDEPWQRAQALSWMFFEQYSHEPYIAVARFIRGWTPLDSPRRADLPRLIERGEQAFYETEAQQFQANARAWANFQAFPPGYRRVAIHRVVSAKGAETRARRMTILIDACADGVKLVSATKRQA